MLNRVVEADISEHIDHFVERLVDFAREKKDDVQGEFNNVVFVVSPSDGTASARRKYLAELYKD